MADGRLTTHVLDTMHGRPAAGVKVELFRIFEDRREELAVLETNADGRLDQPILSGESFAHGIYELVFHVGDYFRGMGALLTDPPFLDVVPVRFGVGGSGEHYHVPLLVSPFSFSTYRGS